MNSRCWPIPVILVLAVSVLSGCLGGISGECEFGSVSIEEQLHRARQSVGSTFASFSETCFFEDEIYEPSEYILTMLGRDIHLICDNSIDGCTIEHGTLKVTSFFEAKVFACCTETDCYVGIGTTDLPCE